MDIKTKVALKACATYDDDIVLGIVRELTDALGGIGKYIEKGMVVALKPNLLLPSKPDNGATTNPAVVGAIGRLVIEAGGKPIIVESPGGPYNKAILRTAYRSCGIDEVCEKFNIELNYDTSLKKVTADCFGRKRSFMVLKPLAEADFVINLPKMKTHGMMAFTGAVKNMFGAIAGTEKAAYHMNVPDYDAFASNMLDICKTISPGLTLMDAVEAMEGNGPSAGKVRKMNLLLASESPYALDMAAHDIIGLPADESYIMAQALERGVSVEYEPTGDSIDDFMVVDYDIPFKKGFGLRKKNLLNSKFITRFKSKPIVDKKTCIGCGICMRNCPAEVIEMKEGKPSFDYSGCIRCFCCQELCPEHAITIKQPLLIKLLKAGRK